MTPIVNNNSVELLLLDIIRSYIGQHYDSILYYTEDDILKFAKVLNVSDISL